MAKEKKIQIPRSFDAQASRFLELRKILRDAEEEKRAIQEKIEPVLAAAPGQCREVGPVTLTLIEVTLNRLDEKEAKEKLGAEVLAPFYHPSTHNRINVK